MHWSTLHWSISIKGVNVNQPEAGGVNSRKHYISGQFIIVSIPEILPDNHILVSDVIRGSGHCYHGYKLSCVRRSTSLFDDHSFYRALCCG